MSGKSAHFKANGLIVCAQMGSFMYGTIRKNWLCD